MQCNSQTQCVFSWTLPLNGWAGPVNFLAQTCAPQRRRRVPCVVEMSKMSQMMRLFYMF